MKSVGVQITLDSPPWTSRLIVRKLHKGLDNIVDGIIFVVLHLYWNQRPFTEHGDSMKSGILLFVLTAIALVVWNVLPAHAVPRTVIEEGFTNWS